VRACVRACVCVCARAHALASAQASTSAPNSARLMRFPRDERTINIESSEYTAPDVAANNHC
jgi:hypothetical protein